MSNNTRKGRSCYVPGCKTGYASDKKFMLKLGIKNVSLFSVPKDPELLRQWKEAIPEHYIKLNNNHVVCALHFLEDDIVKFYETKLPDGTIHRIDRGRPMLKKGAIPSIFPEFLTSLSKSRKRREPPSSCTDKVLIKKESSESETSDQCMFEHLKKNLNFVCTPTKDWSGSFIVGKNEIIFTEWDDDYIAMKKLIINQDLSVNVLFGKVHIAVESKWSVLSSIEDLEELMASIHKMKICSGIKLVSVSKYCKGIGPSRPPGCKGRITTTCSTCKTAMAKKKSNIKKIQIRHHLK